MKHKQYISIFLVFIICCSFSIRSSFKTASIDLKKAELLIGTIDSFCVNYKIDHIRFIDTTDIVWLKTKNKTKELRLFYQNDFEIRNIEELFADSSSLKFNVTDFNDKYKRIRQGLLELGVDRFMKLDKLIILGLPFSDDCEGCDLGFIFSKELNRKTIHKELWGKNKVLYTKIDTYWSKYLIQTRKIRKTK